MQRPAAIDHPHRVLLVAAVLTFLAGTVTALGPASATGATPPALGIAAAGEAIAFDPGARPTPPAPDPTVPPVVETSSTTTTSSAPAPTLPPVQLRGPVLDTDVPDPTLASDGVHVAVFSTNSDGVHVPVRATADFVTWTPVGDALAALPEWARSGMTWAPSVQFIAGRWVLAVAMIEQTSGYHCIGMFAADRLVGPYVSTGGPVKCAARGVIDPELFVDDDGAAHLFWKEPGNRSRQIRGASLDPTTLTLAPATSDLLTATEPWENGGVENPTMVRAGDGYVLLYSGNWWTDARYAIGVALCDTPLGPCHKLTRVAPWLSSTNGAVGPGGQTVLRTHDGRTWLGFHAWRGGVNYQGGSYRALHVEALRFEGGLPAIDVAAAPYVGPDPALPAIPSPTSTTSTTAAPTTSTTVAPPPTSPPTTPPTTAPPTTSPPTTTTTPPRRGLLPGR